MTSVRWIVFDAVGTLLLPRPSVAGIYHAVGQEFGSKLTVEEIQNRFRQAYRESEFCRLLPQEAWADRENFRTTEEDERRIWSMLVASVLDDVCDAEGCFSELFARFEQVSSWTVLPGVEQGLSALRQAGYRLAVASNFDSRLNTLLDGFAEFASIERRVISSEVGCRKPSLYFFRAAERILDAAPNELLMVGDDLVNDIQAARFAGWQALRVVKEKSPTATGEVQSIDDVRAWLQINTTIR